MGRLIIQAPVDLGEQDESLLKLFKESPADIVEQLTILLESSNNDKDHRLEVLNGQSEILLSFGEFELP